MKVIAWILRILVLLVLVWLALLNNQTTTFFGDAGLTGRFAVDCVAVCVFRNGFAVGDFGVVAKVFFGAMGGASLAQGNGAKPRGDCRSASVVVQICAESGIGRADGAGGEFGVAAL